MAHRYLCRPHRRRPGRTWLVTCLRCPWCGQAMCATNATKLESQHVSAHPTHPVVVEVRDKAA